MIRFRQALSGAAALALAAMSGAPVSQAASLDTTTPVKHVVVIFQENVSFDHYFATYPNAANPAGEPAFKSNGRGSDAHGLGSWLLTHNPNSQNPKRLDRSQALTCDMDHNYLDEQKAADGGQMDKFVQYTTGKNCGDVSVMDYYDGNTVTALWNYAQSFAMSDNSFGTTYGPSTPGALNLVSGQTHGFAQTSKAVTANGTVIGDPQPTGDKCDTRDTSTSVDPANKNVGDLLNAKDITWGWFQGGFANCGAQTANIGGKLITDYIPHHEPFQYYKSTANLQHLPPTSVAMIGKTDQANHQYDLSDFWGAADSDNMPAVSFLKAPAAQDGHAGYSDPLDEQEFLVNTINHLEKLPTWSNTVVFISYDDSDGWYDHVRSPLVSPSNDPNNDFMCGNPPPGAYPDRCGYGPRLPLLVVSPFAKRGYIEHSVSDQSSILRFIEDNWQLGRIGDQSFDALAGTMSTMFDFHLSYSPLILDPSTGEPVTP